MTENYEFSSQNNSNTTNTHELLFDNLKKVAAVLVQTMGRNCEVAIHDFIKLPHSLIHIEGNITKRKPGAPITDLVIRALRREGDSVADIPNYQNITKAGRVLKSSTSFIRNEAGKVIGAFCVNFDITEYLNSISMLDDFVKINGPDDARNEETFASTLSETIESLMEREISNAGKQPSTMTKEEKVQLVEALEFQGAFLLKGAVNYVAHKLGVTKFTIYSYLKEVRR